MKYSVSFGHSIAEGDYYVNDTLDTYYVVYPTGDTTYHYILDSTYIPLTITNYAYRDVNRMDYLSLGLFVSLDVVKLDYFRLFAKMGLTADLPVACSGSYFIEEEPYQYEIQITLHPLHRRDARFLRLFLPKDPRAKRRLPRWRTRHRLS